MTTTDYAARAAEVPLAVEKLDCYRVALEFERLASVLLPRGERVLRDQLQRAAVSIVANTAEGAGRWSKPDKARFYAIASGSASECAALVALARNRDSVSAEECARARVLLVRIIQMLAKLIGRMQ
jgi:four helix bundle protein